MAATPCRRQRLKPPALLATLLLALLPAARSHATTFDTGPELGRRLLHNVVRIEARDLAEHGFGFVVGVDRNHVYIATARHVVARRAPAGLAEPERPSVEIVVGFCAGPGATRQPATMLDGFDGADDDLALLRTVRPPDYAPQLDALAPPGQESVGDQAWQLGRESDCVVVPTPGVIAARPDARNTVRVDLHGALGGASGGPLVSGYGIVGLVKRSDNEVIRAHAIADVAARVRAMAAVPFQLVEAGNVPPGDPEAAVADLTETLNDYLFAVRDLHVVLGQEVVPRPTFAGMVQRYSGAVDRFKTARDKYDGTLQRNWRAGTFQEWQALRERLWTIHMQFFGLNGERAATITRTERSPPPVRQQMAALEPELAALQQEIARFADHLGTRRIDHADLSK
jgi:hypothetical protein